jgi:hypothetical protein
MNAQTSALAILARGGGRAKKHWKARAEERQRWNDRLLDSAEVVALHLLITTTKNTDDTWWICIISNADAMMHSVMQIR